MIIGEIPNSSWSLQPLLEQRADRSNVKTGDYLRERGIVWRNGASRDADVLIRKESHELVSARTLARRPLLFGASALRRELTLIGEPVEFAPLAYATCSPRRTLAVAPGSRFQRMIYGGEWLDPELDDWSQREDAIVWIARPYPWRIRYARELLARGVPLVVHSRYDWGLSCWRGPAESDVAAARKYKYRLVSENFKTNLCHTEKLWLSLRSGCVTFYDADVALDIAEIRGLSLMPTHANFVNRHELAGPVLERMNQFIYGDEWAFYSLAAFFDRIIDLARRA